VWDCRAEHIFYLARDQYKPAATNCLCSIYDFDCTVQPSEFVFTNTSGCLQSYCIGWRGGLGKFRWANHLCIIVSPFIYIKVQIAAPLCSDDIYMKINIAGYGRVGRLQTVLLNNRSAITQRSSETRSLTLAWGQWSIPSGKHMIPTTCSHGSMVSGLGTGRAVLMQKTKSKQEIVCGCSVRWWHTSSMLHACFRFPFLKWMCKKIYLIDVLLIQGKPPSENTKSCQCKCHATIKLLRTPDNGWYKTRAMFEQFGQNLYKSFAYRVEKIEKGKIYMTRNTNASQRQKWSIVNFRWRWKEIMKNLTMCLITWVFYLSGHALKVIPRVIKGTDEQEIN
jgi:hypothetical protein